MRTVVQIAPEIAPGSGVAGVAYQLEQCWQAAGVPTERFTMTDAGGDFLPAPGPGLRGRLVHVARVVWFSTVGTIRARRFLARRPEAVSVCHNDVLAGDVYVNHGILRAAMAARGHAWFRMVRNPLHLFTAGRDWLRYHSSVHRVVVSLTRAEEALLRSTYRGLRPRSVVIGNGVSTRRFSPATPTERVAARTGIDPAGPLPEDALVVLFVGHEFGRKGLPLVVEAMADGPERVHLLVVGGDGSMVAAARRWAAAAGVGDRVHLLGVLPDPLPAFRAADALVLPSAYEANALVVLEALAAGLPVLATPVGYAPDIVSDGVNGYLVERTAESVREGLTALDRADLERLREGARASAAPLDWEAVAHTYLDLLGSLEGGSTHRDGPAGDGR